MSKKDIICENTWKTVKHQTNYCDWFKGIETKFSNIFSDREKKEYSVTSSSFSVSLTTPILEADFVIDT